MEIAETGFMSMMGFGLIVVLGGLIMAAVSFFSMKETSFEDVVAAQKRKKDQEDKERSRLNKQKREHFKEKFKQKKKKEVNGKVPESVSAAHEVQIKRSVPVPKKAPVAPVAATQAKPAPQVEQKKAKATKQTVQTTVKAVKKTEAPSAPKPEVVATAQKASQPTKPAAKAPKQPAKQPAAKPAPAKPAPVEQHTAPNKKSTKPREHKVSFSEDVQTVEKPIVASVAEELGKQKKKSKKQEENPVVEIVKSAELNHDVAKKLIDVLKAKTGNDLFSSIPEFLDLKVKLKSKEAENQQNYKESASSKIKIQELTSKIEMERQTSEHKIFEFQSELEKSKQNSDNLAQQLQILTQQQSQMQVMAVSNDKLKQLKDENEILKLTIQSNANEVQEKNRISVELKAVRDQLQLSENAKNDLERKVQEFNGSIQQRQADIEKSYSLRLEEMTEKLHAAQGQYDHLESDFQKAQSDLQLTQTESAKLLDQVVLLTEATEQKSVQDDDQYNSLMETKQELERRLDDMDAKDNEKADELAKLNMTNKDLKKKCDQLSAEVEKLQINITNNKNDSSSLQQDIEKLNTQINEKVERISCLEKQLKDTTGDIDQKHQGEVEKLKKKNNDLRERNWKAMDAVAAAEKLAKDHLVTKDDLEATLSKTHVEVKGALQKAFPTVECNCKDFDDWVSNFLTSAAQSVVVESKVVESTSNEELEALRKEKSALEVKAEKLGSKSDALETSLSAALHRNKEYEALTSCQEKDIAATRSELEKFKVAISSTEELLIQLQSAAEKEEKEKEQLLLRAKEEKERALGEERKLREEIEKTLKEKSGVVDEVVKERDSLKVKLSETESELNESQAKLSEVSFQQEEDTSQTFPDAASVESESPVPVSDGEVKLTEDDQGFLIIEHQPANQQSQEVAQTNGHDQDEMAKLKERLDKEKKLTKDLGTAAGKLQTVLKQTQDQLNKERQKNRELIKKYSKSDKSSSSSSSSELD